MWELQAHVEMCQWNLDGYGRNCVLPSPQIHIQVLTLDALECVFGDRAFKEEIKAK